MTHTSCPRSSGSAIQANTEASDYVRLHFHAITGWALPRPGDGCRTCWADVVFLLLGEECTPAEVLAAQHLCTGDWNCGEILAKELTEHPEKW